MSEAERKKVDNKSVYIPILKSFTCFWEYSLFLLGYSALLPSGEIASGIFIGVLSFLAYLYFMEGKQ